MHSSSPAAAPCYARQSTQGNLCTDTVQIWRCHLHATVEDMLLACIPCRMKGTSCMALCWHMACAKSYYFVPSIITWQLLPLSCALVGHCQVACTDKIFIYDPQTPCAAAWCGRHWSRAVGRCRTAWRRLWMRPGWSSTAPTATTRCAASATTQCWSVGKPGSVAVWNDHQRSPFLVIADAAVLPTPAAGRKAVRNQGFGRLRQGLHSQRVMNRSIERLLVVSLLPARHGTAVAQHQLKIPSCNCSRLNDTNTPFASMRRAASVGGAYPCVSFVFTHM